MSKPNKHLFQMTTEEFIEVIREVVLSVVPPINNLTGNQIKKEEKDCLTREETKNLLKLSYTTLWKYDKTGILLASRIGSKVYYLKSDIDFLLTEGKSNSIQKNKSINQKNKML